MKQIRFSHLKMSQLPRVFRRAAEKLVMRRIQREGTPTAGYTQAAAPVCAEDTLKCRCWNLPTEKTDG